VSARPTCHAHRKPNGRAVERGDETSGGPTGDGHLNVTFAPSGDVQSAVLDQPPFTRTAVGECIARRFRDLHIPPFAGGAVTIGLASVVE
jgi:hypothetical protein